MNKKLRNNQKPWNHVESWGSTATVIEQIHSHMLNPRPLQTSFIWFNTVLLKKKKTPLPCTFIHSLLSAYLFPIISFAMIQHILLLWGFFSLCKDPQSFVPVHYFSPHCHISANKHHAGSSSPALSLWLMKSFPRRSSSSCPSAGRAPWRALALTEEWGLFSSLGAAAEEEKGQKLLVLLLFKKNKLNYIQ